MKSIPMYKAVRDNIPDIIVKDNQSPVYEIVSEDYWRHLLTVKLKEEAGEYAKSGEDEELADILEIVYALAELNCTSKAELEMIRKKKRRERGGFEKRFYLRVIETEV